MGRDITVDEPPSKDCDEDIRKILEDGWCPENLGWENRGRAHATFNYREIWNQVAFNPDDFHLMSSETVVIYMLSVIEKLKPFIQGDVFSSEEYTNLCTQNCNFYWGLDKDRNFLDVNTRRKIVLFHFERYLSLAQETPGCYWFNDHENYTGPYTDDNGVIHRGLGRE